VDTPALVIHGYALHVNLTNNLRFTLPSGADKNVPTWHSREAVSILKTWAADAIVEYVHSLHPYFHFFYHCYGSTSYREDQGQGHWYASVFKNVQVKAFLDSVLAEKRDPPRRSPTFTLTTAVPADTGSLHGWRILGLLSPGR
jgi:hypothetical protein